MFKKYKWFIILVGVLVALVLLYLFVLKREFYGYISTHQCAMCAKISDEQIKSMNRDYRCAPTNVTGTLIDSRCYSLDKRNVGNDHYSSPSAPNKDVKNCGTNCAEGGVPVGILPLGATPGKSQVYILLSSSKELAPYIGQLAQVTGQFMTDSNAIFTLNIKVKDKDGKWKEVSSGSYMDKYWAKDKNAVASRCCVTV